MRVWWDVATSASDAFFIVKLSPFLYLLTAGLSVHLWAFVMFSKQMQPFIVVSKTKQEQKQEKHKPNLVFCLTLYVLEQS